MNTIHERILCVAPARHWIVVASVRPRDSSSIRFEEKTTIANDLEKEREGDGGGGAFDVNVGPGVRRRRACV